MRITPLVAAALASLPFATSIPHTSTFDKRNDPSRYQRLATRNCAQLPSSPDIAVRNQIYQIALEMGVNSKVMLSMMETAITESYCNNLDCGDRDSLGVFQQQWDQGWGTPSQLMNVTYSTRAFLTVCIQEDKENPNVTPGELAQIVQQAQAGNRYDGNQALAEQFISEARAAVGGSSPPPPAPPASHTTTSKHSGGSPTSTSHASPTAGSGSGGGAKPGASGSGDGGSAGSGDGEGSGTNSAQSPALSMPEGSNGAQSLPPPAAGSAGGAANANNITISSDPGDGSALIGADGDGVEGTFVSGTVSTDVDPERDGVEDGCTVTYVPVPGDDCLGVSSRFNITLEDFYTWNPCLDMVDCQNLQILYPYCVSTSNATAAAIQMSTSPNFATSLTNTTLSGTSSNVTSSSANPVPDAGGSEAGALPAVASG